MTLLDAARMFNKDALVEIFNSYSSALYKYVFRLCHDAFVADQIVGDVFAKLLEQLSSGRGPKSNLRAYLFETAYHILIDDVRCSQRTDQLDPEHFQQSDENSLQLSLENRMTVDSIRRAIQDDLTDEQRHVIILRFMEGFSVLDTAVIIGKNVNSVKVMQNRAITKLRKVLNGRQRLI